MDITFFFAVAVVLFLFTFGVLHLFQRGLHGRKKGEVGSSSLSLSTDVQRGLKYVEQYSIDFTSLAEHGKLDPVVGRTHEVEQLIRILSRKSKNNALLLGEPGVGKTAVVEKLAVLITTGHVPERLRGQRILALDLPSLMSGTKYRGELEKRLDALRAAFQSAASHIILFLDEIHQLSQASGSEGGLNPGDIFKPVLARGELQVIGATTYEDYEKYIVSDEGLDRRFQPIHVHEPSRDEALEIVLGVQSVYARFHNVRYPTKTLNAIVDLSKHYVHKRYLPDKAIDVLDEAGVWRRLQSLTHSSKPATVTVDDVRHVIAEWTNRPLSTIRLQSKN